MKTILFQGDSITDASRIREDGYHLGTGYAYLVSANLAYENPYEYKFLNRGIGGNRITDVYARIKSDIINLRPDIMSLLVGVNDAWHEVEEQNGVDPDKFFTIYDMMLDEIKKALPDLKMMIFEPYVLKGTLTEEHWDELHAEVLKRAKKVEEIAKKHNIKFIPLQNLFDEVSKDAPSDYWTCDGVHPTQAGHELIKREWLKAFSEI